MKGKRIYDLESLEVGATYFVHCSIWSGFFIYCGHVHSEKKYTFTCGSTVDSWRKSWNIVSCKSNLKVYNVS